MSPFGEGQAGGTYNYTNYHLFDSSFHSEWPVWMCMSFLVSLGMTPSF